MTLFVGGVWDGRRAIIDPKLKTVRIPTFREDDYGFFGSRDDCPKSSRIEYHEYRRVDIAGSAVFVHAAMDDDQLVQALLDNYKPKQFCSNLEL